VDNLHNPTDDASKDIERYNSAKSARSPRESDWKKQAAYCLPSQYSGWVNEGSVNITGNAVQSVSRIAYDTTGMRALPKYTAILERMCTPHNMKWHILTATKKSLNTNIAVQRFFDELNDIIFSLRYDPAANFRQAMAEVYASLGVYGTGVLYLGTRNITPTSKTKGFLYKACPIKDIFLLTNESGSVDTVMRRFFLNARQFKQKFPKSKIPPSIETKMTNGKDNEYVEFIHIVQPRVDFDPESISTTRMPAQGKYICVNDKMYVGEDEGYESMPYLVCRVYTEAGDPYGYGPAAQALPALGTASAIKKTVIRQGQKAVDPVILAHDDGVLNSPVDLRAGAVNYGGVDKQGRKLIHALEAGNFNVSEALLQDERADINDCFFVTLFQILTDTNTMTATEVMERVAEKSALCSPTQGRIQSELLGPEVMRALDIAHSLNKIPEMPPELVEANDYEIVYTSPLAKSMYAEEVSGFMRAVETALTITQSTGNQAHLDHFNFDTAIPEISNYMGVPSRWLNDIKSKQQLAGDRQEQMQQQELMKNAAPLSSALKTLTQAQGGKQ
jgi:hypothetical protein